jgi:decaprenylphospho-beta-D-ribofuranose 2-oxidase
MHKGEVRTNWSKSSEIRHINDLDDDVSKAQDYVKNSKSITLIGNGRSYSENCIPTNGVPTRFQRREPILLAENSLIRTGPFTTIRELWSLIEGSDFTLPVVPGTGMVTVGGAIACDVHGKSHHRDGSFGEHIRRIKLINGSGELLELTPEGEYSDMFWATVGGIGVTGIIVEAEIGLRSVSNQSVVVGEKRTIGLRQTMDELNSLSHDFPYTAAWFDLSTKPEPRGIITYAFDCNDGEQKRISSEKYKVSIPELPFNLIRPVSISMFNQLWYKKPLKKGVLNPVVFHHPLDGVGNWNNLFGKNGPIQYQFVVPHSSANYIEAFVRRCQYLNLMSPLVVLKNLRYSNAALLSFPMEGWTMAVDFPRSERVIEFLKSEIDRLIHYGGRTYLAKDELTNSQQFKRMYPQFDRFLNIKGRMDVNGKFQSKLSRKLGFDVNQ